MEGWVVLRVVDKKAGDVIVVVEQATVGFEATMSVRQKEGRRDVALNIGEGCSL